MKRTIIASILGIAASAANSYGEGQVIFSTYISSIIAAPVVWGDTSHGHIAGQAITAADGFCAELFYGIGSGLSFSQLKPIPSTITLVGSIVPGAIVVPDDGVVTLPDWTSGPVTFGISVYNVADWASSTSRTPNDATWTEPASTIAPIGFPANPFTLALLQAAYPNGFILNWGEQEPHFIYNIPNGAVTIAGYVGPGGSITIPSAIDGLPVTRIGDRAFQGYAGLTSVTIPDSVMSIGDWAFDYCTNLTSINVEALNSAYSSVDGVLFNKSQTTLIQYPGGKAGSYTIPSSVTSIGDWAFHGCLSLSSVTIPNSVTRIGWGAFESCGLSSLTLPNSATSIGTEAFCACGSLTNVTIPQSVTAIGQEAFYYCKSLTSVTLAGGVSSIGPLAFASCPSLTGVYFKGNAPGIDVFVFDGDAFAIVYYMPGTTGWGPTFGGRPTVLWVLPSASNIAAATFQDQPLGLVVAKPLALASHPISGSLSVTSIDPTSTNGGSVVFGPDQIIYAPVSGYVGADRFSYTVTDAMDASATGYVFVQVLATNQMSGNMFPLAAISGGYLVSFAGIPERNYSVQRAPTVTGPWTTLATVSVGLNGIGSYQDTNPPAGTAFYRTTYP